jgi:hypothetical protein
MITQLPMAAAFVTMFTSLIWLMLTWLQLITSSKKVGNLMFSTLELGTAGFPDLLFGCQVNYCVVEMIENFFQLTYGTLGCEI